MQNYHRQIGTPNGNYHRDNSKFKIKTFNFPLLTFNLQKGQSLVEIILAMGLAAIILPALLTGLVSSRQGKAQQAQRTQAVYLLNETVDAVRSVREKGWATFAVNGTYFPTISGSSWILASGSASVNGLIQKIDIGNVYRATSGAIVATGGSLDPSSKKVDVSISWGMPYVSTVSASLFITRYLSNNSFNNTTVSDFTPGILGNTQITSTDGGEITLANNNKAKWCSPAFSPISIDLPDGPPVAVAANADPTSVNIPNDVFAATAPNDASSIKLAYVKVTANTDNPVPALQGTFTLDASKYSSGTYPSSLGGLTNSFKTNDVKYYKSGSGKVYALLATDLPDHEVVAAQINNGSGDAYQDPVNKIYKYWTYFNTRMYDKNVVLDTGFANPAANSAETGSNGDNNGFELNPTRAYSDNASFAVDTNSGSNTGISCTGADKDKHRFYNYGFSIPSGTAISGIEVRLDAKADSISGGPKMCVQLSWDAGATWTVAKSTNTLTTSEATYILGGSSDSWGRSWSDTNFSNANFRLRVIDVASDITRDFSLDWAAVKVYYSGSSGTNDQAPFNYGTRTITILGTKGYLASGGYLYAFDLSNIDSKTPTSELDQIGCRIELDGYDCLPGGSASDKKYSAGETGASWSNIGSPAHNDCSDGGNIELFADNHLASVQIGASNYIYVAVGAGTNPEFEIVNATSVPDLTSSPAVTNSSCGRISGGNAGWKMIGSLDFNSKINSEEAANSVYAKSDGTRAYVSSNGGIDANGDGIPDSKQFYVINTANKTSPAFLSGAPGSPSYGPLSGFYYGSGANAQLYPRRSLTVLNGDRAILVGKDAVSDGNNAQEYQVVDITSEASPLYCGGLDFNQGFNDLTSVSEADGDNFVYMVANTPDKQLKIIQGGPDAGIYVSGGTFESPVFDPTFSVAYNRFTASVNQPALTTVKAQVAVAPPVGESCASAIFNYVGPNGIGGASPSAYFTTNTSTISGTIPFEVSGLYQNPNRCFRYKFYLDSTDPNKTPSLNDININYSP